MNISTFLIGFATALFGVFAIHILFWRRARTRFQTVVGIIMAIWAVWCAKDLILTFPGMYREDVLSWILMIDGWSALTYMVLVVEVVMPGWTTWKRILLLFIPFAIFTVVYAALPRMEVIYAYSVFLWIFAWTVVDRCFMVALFLYIFDCRTVGMVVYIALCPDLGGQHLLYRHSPIVAYDAALQLEFPT